MTKRRRGSHKGKGPKQSCPVCHRLLRKNAKGQIRSHSVFGIKFGGATGLVMCSGK